MVNVGKYTIHGCYGIQNHGYFQKIKVPIRACVISQTYLDGNRY